MPASNNTILLDGCIQEFVTQSELELSEDEIFEIFSLSQIAHKLGLSYDEMIGSVVDGGNDGGIDVFLIVIDDKSIQTEDDLDEIIFSEATQVKIFMGQAKLATRFVEVGLDKIITSLPLIYNLELTEDQLIERFNPSLVEKIKIFQLCWEKAISKRSSIEMNFYYSTRANEKRLKGTFEAKVNQIKELTVSNIFNAEVKFDTYSAQELLNLFQTPKITNFPITLKETPAPIEYGGDKFGYIGVSKLKDFYAFIVDEDSELRENIFENNIRHYQGNIDVNKKIKKSVEEDYTRDFWWLNNGITIIASSVRPLGKKLILENPQIVNGLQTSFTLFNTYEPSEEDDRSILIKIIESTDKETIDKVISSTNSQSPVSPTLLKATDEFQRNLELYFLTKGYFYDRRKNYYKNQGKPASKIFNIQATAQAIEAIKNWSPASARSRPTTLIKTDTAYNAIFKTDIDLGVYLQCCLVVQASKKYINHHVINEEKGILRNFTYHLSRIAMSLDTEASHYSVSDILGININLFNRDALETAHDFLNEAISLYMAMNTHENIINISKAKSFSDFLNTQLITHFASE